ncbi:MAG TPA: 2,3-bisphosphoglycerate-independent phosphoglycerate mutase [Trueperaceae bacterium]|nr:2,3-bisphosphoglycerate-independent phosphoglycerate mutase [Trueperaceae bacterium]
MSGAARPVMLVVLDGFGLAPPGPGNAVDLARTPVFDAIWASGPRTTLEASGTAVGLPAGQMGNSEVGHMNIGAGRRVMQSLTYVQEQIDDGGFYENAVLREAYAAGRGGTLHLIGLVSDGGVHSDLPHLLALLELAARLGQPRVRVHVVTDGRDSAPDGSPAYVAAVERKLAEVAARGVDARIASVTGRYFAMDRDRRWDRTAVAYDAVVCGRAPHVAATATEAVREAYARGETDEFIRPTVVGRAEPMRDGDAVVFFNFRADRARQLTYALTQEGFAGFRRCATPRVHFASLMEYDAELGLPFAFALPPLTKGLSEVVSAAGLRQYHTAETEKYAHVTYFFNLQREEPFPGEDRLLVPSPQVATYDLKPEMSAPELTDATVARIAQGVDDFLLINYANPDMVGHTGVLSAAVSACEAVDAGLGRVLDAWRARGGVAVVIADHGNAEQMLTPAGEPHTAHTTNPVPCVLVSDDPAVASLRLRDGGALGDVAPTVLELMGLPQPPEMTGASLLVR